MSAAAGGGSFGAELDLSCPEECSFTFSETSLTNGGNGFFLETPPPPSSTRDDGVSCSTTEDVKIALKFLLSNVAAGIVIGKAGTNITLLQEVSGARIQLSRNNVFYPGTVERVLLLTGAVRSVLISLYLILVKLTGRSKWQAKTTGESCPVVDDNITTTDIEGETTQVKIVMPAAVCGAIIGRGGETVRSFADDSGASISVSPQERTNRPDRMGPATDRIVTITGGVSQILRAVALIVTTVAEDPNYVRNVGLSVNYAPRPNTGGSGGCGTPTTVPAPHPTAMLLNSSPALLGPTPRAASFSHSPTPSSGSFSQSVFPAPQDAASVFAGATTPQRSGSSLTGRNVEWKLPVPDEHVGAIIGKGGEILAQLQCLVGVKVTISGRGEFEPGTRNRVVAISGPPEAVKIGHIIITQKVNERIEQLQRQGSI